MVNLTTLATELAKRGADEAAAFPFEVNPIPGDVEVLQILVEDREELPIFISASEEQILCIAYLFPEHEIKEGQKDALNQSMLAANITMPLSAFGMIEQQYVVYGALATSSSMDDIVHEIEVLSSNTIEAIDALRDYLK